MTYQTDSVAAIDLTTHDVTMIQTTGRTLYQVRLSRRRASLA
jgi:hypothetical protein